MLVIAPSVVCHYHLIEVIESDALLQQKSLRWLCSRWRSLWSRAVHSAAILPGTVAKWWRRSRSEYNKEGRSEWSGYNARNGHESLHWWRLWEFIQHYFKDAAELGDVEFIRRRHHHYCCCRWRRRYRPTPPSPPLSTVKGTPPPPWRASGNNVRFPINN